MIEANVKDAETKMQKSLDALAKEILTIRTGRSSQALVDKIPVEYYGNPTPLNQLATITIPEARMIIIQPWDRTIIGAVEKAIQKSELGLNFFFQAEDGIRDYKVTGVQTCALQI